MRHVAHRHRVLLLDVGQERPLVVDLEVEDAVLVGQLEAGGEGGGVRCGERGRGGEGEAVEGGEHRELELQEVVRGDGEGGPGVPGVFGEGDCVCLCGELV